MLNKSIGVGFENHSFPSGHTSISFCLASNLWDHYGPGIGIPLYLAAIVTGASRMQDDRHFFSDVVAGATIGMIVGHAYSRHHLDLSKKDVVVLLPYYDGRNSFGAVLVKRF